MLDQDSHISVRYITDADGNKTDVLIPLEAWQTLLATWKELITFLEDQEDRTTLQAWLEKRARGEGEMISLEALEQELIADGLISR